MNEEEAEVWYCLTCNNVCIFYPGNVDKWWGIGKIEYVEKGEHHKLVKKHIKDAVDDKGNRAFEFIGYFIGSPVKTQRGNE